MFYSSLGGNKQDDWSQHDPSPKCFPITGSKIAKPTSSTGPSATVMEVGQSSGETQEVSAAMPGCSDSVRYRPFLNDPVIKSLLPGHVVRSNRAWTSQSSHSSVAREDSDRELSWKGKKKGETRATERQTVKVSSEE
ncbi:unnamed protein product [Pleuronectes platessa]|uniref:Uncharacterized protein n=1 Tax=Pleuronectes platessa TaxID=8262 RepID=A0A9N7V8Z7_PLEPL|nr:unnamed protein product [Pleuronectes platessa]